MTPQTHTAQGWKGLEFRLGSIPVLIRPMFFLIALVLGLRGGSPSAQGAAWVGIVFFSVLVHELGHALAMRAFGFSPSIELHAMGGLTSWSREKLPSAGQRLVVTLCGPGAGLVLGLLVTLALRSTPPTIDPLLGWVLLQAQYVNIAWSLVNLLPVLPWDGGLITDSAVELVARRPRPKVAGAISLVVGVAIVGVAVLRVGLPNGIMLVYFGGMGIWRGWARFSAPLTQDQSGPFWALMQGRKFVEAERSALEQLVSTPEGPEQARLYELVAWSRLLREDWAGADAAIAQMKGVTPSRHLAATLAAHTGRHEEALALLTPLPIAANELALRTDCLIALGRPDEVVRDANEVLLRPQDSDLRRGVQLMSARLFDAQAWEPSLQVCLAAFAKLGEPLHLFNAACALVKLGRADDAIAALHRAVDAGYKERPTLLEDPDLAPLRGLSAWAGLLERLPPRAA